MATHLLFSVFSCAVTFTSWDSVPVFSSLSSTVFSLELGVREWKNEAAEIYRNWGKKKKNQKPLQKKVSTSHSQTTRTMKPNKTQACPKDTIIICINRASNPSNFSTVLIKLFKIKAQAPVQKLISTTDFFGCFMCFYSFCSMLKWTLPSKML